MRKRIINILVVLLSVCFLVVGCGVTYNENNENIQFVKRGTNSAYPNTTYGKAFDAFFADPTWGYFVADTGEDVVEFTGNCFYDNVEVEALVQFTLDKGAGTFEVTYVSFNDVTQNQLVVSALLEAIFEGQ